MRGSLSQIITVPFSKISELERGFVGSKAFHLGRLVSLRLPVPNGFVVTTSAFDQHFTSRKLDDFIKKELSGLDPSDSVRLENISKRIRRGILRVNIDKDMKSLLTRAYSSLSGFSDSYVAVRSSSPTEDLRGDSFAGQYGTYLNIKGKDDVIEKIKYCWASLYSPQNIFYSMSKGYDVSSQKMAVIVQKMIQAEASGVMFTINPIDNDETKITIECILGLGEALVHGQLTPDSYVVNKSDNEVIEKKIIPQEWMLVRKGRTKKGEDPNVKVKISDVWKVRQKLENKYIEKLAKVGIEIEKHFDIPQDIEWVYEGGRIWIVQTRPITTLKIEDDSWKRTPTFAALKSKVEASGQKKVVTRVEYVSPKKKVEKIQKEEPKVILSGRGTNRGKVSGPVRIVTSTKKLSKIERGSILVVSKITSKYEDKLHDIAAIVTDEIGRDSYETIMAKSLGIPCVVETQIATKVLRNGEFVSVDGSTGEVSAGVAKDGLIRAERILQKRDKAEDADVSSEKSEYEITPARDIQPSQFKTATKILVNINDTNEAVTLAGMDYDGVGNMSSERIIKGIGIHPRSIAQSRKDKQRLVDAMTLELFRTAKSFEPRAVIYRLSDVSSKEYQSLSGGKQYEMTEENPKMGFRGAGRLMENTEELEMELEAIRVVRNKENVKNVWIAIPFVRSLRELKEMKHLISSYGLRRSSTLKLLIVLQVPAAIIRLEQMLDIGIDGVVVDTYSLSQFMLGIDRNNPKLAPHYKETHPAIMWAIEKTLKVCNKAKIYSQLNGEMITKNPGALKKIVGWGVNSISIDSDNLESVRKSVYEAEKALFVRKK
jgi:pyruvate,water dikinase